MTATGATRVEPTRAVRISTLLVASVDDTWVPAAWRERVAAAAAAHGGTPLRPLSRETIAAATFARPVDALEAALRLAGASGAGEGPDGPPPAVRAALDTHGPTTAPGLAAARLGIAVARCARLCAVARDGQVLLSRATRDLVADHLPEGIDLADLGVHRLPDLGQPERVYATVRPDAPRAGPLRSLDELPNNLPRDLTTFVGRERELAEVARAVAGARLVTLTGAGGCGKTRLALQSGADAAGLFPDGVWWVDLAPVPDAGLVGQAVARALGVRPLPGRTALDAAVAHLAARRALVLLDNCEHLVESAGEVAEALAEGCPEVHLLATSRAPLGVDSETVWRVPSLSLPDPDADPSPDALARSDAVRLFLERAAKVRPDLDVAGSGAALAELCARLDGIPLAIELAAARIGLMSVERIAAGLTDRFQLLTRGSRSALPRHRTLRASVDWSHDLLSEPERTVLRRLGAFSGGFTTEAVERVALDGVDLGAAEALAALVDNSLVVVERWNSQIRHRLLETVREYALERLDEAGEAEAVRDRHRDFFLALAERAAPGLVTARQLEWLDALDADGANLGAALERACATDAERALRLCTALTLWWKRRGKLAEAERCCEAALEAADPAPSALRARVIGERAYLLTFAGRYGDAIATAERALAMAEEVGDAGTAARALSVLGTARHGGDPLGCRAPLERSRQLARASGDDWCFVRATHILGRSHLTTDDYDVANRLFEECRAVAERVGNLDALSWTLFSMSQLRLFQGDFERFQELAERAVAAAHAVGEPSKGHAQVEMAYLEVARGHAEQALERLEASRLQLIATGAGFALPQTDVVIAVAQAALGDLDAARGGLEEVVASGGDFGWTLVRAILELADVLRVAGDLTGARERARTGLELSDRIGTGIGQAWAREVLGRVAAASGEWREAETLLDEALAIRADLELRLYLPQSLDAVAEVSAGLGDRARAARLLGAAERARRDLGLVRWGHHRPRAEALERDLRAALGDEPFGAALRDGAGLGLDDAVARAREESGSRRRATAGWESLTRTERDVARRAADGMTNREIAEAAFVAPATVKTHLAHVYAKLGVHNRAELTAELARHVELER
ncbi:MAG TPA: tetratricopeptide repeat protein [Thermoleophilaceae bacterium]|jgi:predicted ATPase/DNA-binding CsgD family transcriptional regulator